MSVVRLVNDIVVSKINRHSIVKSVDGFEASVNNIEGISVTDQVAHDTRSNIVNDVTARWLVN